MYRTKDTPKTLLCQRQIFLNGKINCCKEAKVHTIVTRIVFGTWQNVSKLYLEKRTGENVSKMFKEWSEAVLSKELTE